MYGELCLPRIVDASFEEKLSKLNLTEESQKNLAGATKARAKIMNMVKTSNFETSKNALSALGIYIPLLHTMVDQAEQVTFLPPKSFLFKWGSTLGRNHLSTADKNLHPFTTLGDELAQVYFVYGLIHFLNAHHIVADLTEYKEGEDKSVSTKRATDRKEAVRLLRVACGVFQALPIGPSESNERPLDTRKPTVDALANLCLADAQVLTIQGAIEKGMKNELLGKLCIGVSDRFQSIREKLGKGLAHNYHALHPTLNLYLKNSSELYKAIAHRLIAISCSEGSRMDYGHQVAFNIAAENMLKKMIIPNNNSKTLDALRKQLSKELVLARDARKETASDNESIYFKPVPKVKELEVPNGLFMVKPLEFEQPATVSKVFFEQKVKSDNQESKEAQLKSDEELARSLQSSDTPQVGVEGMTRKVTFQKGDVGINFEGNEIKKVTPGSQAAKAGILPGWTILYVNGDRQPCKHKTIRKAIKKTHGKGKPTVVTFQINFDKVAKHFTSKKDHPQATFWSFQHNKYNLAGKSDTIVSNAHKRCGTKWNGFPAFLEQQHKNGSIKQGTTWDEVEKLWKNKDNKNSESKMSEDEALALALSQSLEESKKLQPVQPKQDIPQQKMMGSQSPLQQQSPFQQQGMMGQQQSPFQQQGMMGQQQSPFQQQGMMGQPNMVRQQSPFQQQGQSQQQGQTFSPPSQQGTMGISRNYPERTFACARCGSHFKVQCGPNTQVKCPTCGAPNMIP